MNKFFVILLLALALAVRCFRLEQPPLDFHPVRQYIGATVARAMYFADEKTIPAERREIALAMRERQGVLEPQVLPTLAAWGYRLAGGEQLWIPRLISAVCWLLGGVFLRHIAAKLVSAGAALAALAFYLFMPYAIMGSRSFQPDPMMVMLMLGSLALVLDYDEQPRKLSGLLGATVVVLAAMWVRPMASLFVFPAFVFLAMARRGFFGGLFHWHTIFFAVVPVLPAAVFYLHSAQQGGFISEHSSFTFMPHLWREDYYWQGWLKMIGRTAGWLPALAGLLAALFLAKGRLQRVLLGLWGGYLVYGLIFNYHIHTHDYYSLPLLPIVALSLAPLVDRSSSGLGRMWAQCRGALIGMTLLALIGVAATGWAGKKFVAKNLSPEIKGQLKSAGALVGFDKKFLLFLGREDALNRMAVADWEEIGKIVGHSRKTIMLAEDFGQAMMYHGEFWGRPWPTSGLIAHKHRVGRPTIESVADFQEVARQLGADYFVATFLRNFETQTELHAHVLEHYPVVAQTDRYIVFDLRAGK